MLKILILICLYFINRRSDGTVHAELQNRKANNDRVEKHKKIYGGTIPTEIGNFPYIASVRDKQSRRHLCAGVIISKFNILTTCHCVTYIRDNSVRIENEVFYYVVVGVPAFMAYNFENMQNDDETQYISVKNITIHRNCEKWKNIWLKDFAVLKLDQAIVMSKVVSSVNILSQIKKRDSLLKLFLMGIPKCSVFDWGLSDLSTNLTEDTDDDLMWIEVKSVSFNACSDELCQALNLCKERNLIENHYFCVQPLDANQNVCTGNTGGPLICDNYFLGLLSWSSNCGQKRFPSLIARIDQSLDFFMKYSCAGTTGSNLLLVIISLIIKQNN